MNKQDNRGFTLIEMLVVLVIIGILGMAAIPTYQRYLERGHLVQAQADLNCINQAMKTEIVKHPTWSRSEWERFLASTITACQASSPVADKYQYSFVLDSDSQRRRYYLFALPHTSRGNQKALWADSIGNTYRCTDSDSATKREKILAEQGGCEKI